LVLTRRHRHSAIIKAAHPLPRNEQPAQRSDWSIAALGLAQALLSTRLALIVLACGAADAAAAGTVVAPDEAEEEPVEGEDAGLVAGAV
jgi:hypothetical protein